jgi:choline-sulfatase
MSPRRPNILLIVADQLAPHFLPAYGHRVTKTPHLDRIAEGGTVFDAAYTNSPLCVPGRAALFTGRLPSKVGVYDSAGDLRSTEPTMAHYLRGLGYHTVISGKCHFIGVDQMHGFEDRTTSDICPAEPIWFSHWDRDGERPLPWYHTFDNVKTGGLAERSTQQDHDDNVAFTARQWLYDWRRGGGRDAERRPFFMHLSFTHPHDPYVTPKRYWDRFRDDDIDMPVTPYQAYEDRDPYGQWLHRHYDRGEIEVTEDDIRRARHAYYGSIALVDDHIGSVLDTLEGMGELENTAIVFTADHGDMLGERGQWYKMSPFERSARVPTMISLPGTDQRGRRDTPTSNADLLATLVDIATDGDGAETIRTPTEGTSMLPLCAGDATGHPDAALVELFFEGLTVPACALRKGRHKLIRVNETDRLLHDIAADPEETTDLSEDPTHAVTLAALEADMVARYDFTTLRAEIVASQTRRAVVTDALLKGRLASWAYQPHTDASRQYYRVSKTWHEQEEADFLRFDR